MRGRLFSVLASAGLAVAAAVSGGGLGMGAPIQEVLSPRGAPKTRRESRTKSPPASQVYKARGPGWTHAQVQRMALKKRNQARNKRAHRG